MGFPWWFCMFKLFGKQLLHGFLPPTTSSPSLWCCSIRAHLIRPKFNNPLLASHSGCLRLFLNSQMLIRDKLATFPELYIYLYSFRFTDYSVYCICSLPSRIPPKLCCFFQRKNANTCLGIKLWQIVSKAFCLNGFYARSQAGKKMFFSNFAIASWECCFSVYSEDSKMERRRHPNEGAF